MKKEDHKPLAENNTWKIGSTHVQVLVSSHSTAGCYTICRVEAAGGDDVPLHTHHYEDQFFYILEGEFQFEINGEIMLATPGTSLFIPPRNRPYVSQPRRDMGKFLVVAVPGGMDLFMRDLGESMCRHPLPSAGQLAPILEKHGISLPIRNSLDRA